MARGYDWPATGSRDLEAGLEDWDGSPGWRARKRNVHVNLTETIRLEGRGVGGQLDMRRKGSERGERSGRQPERGQREDREQRGEECGGEGAYDNVARLKLCPHVSGW